MGEHLFRVEARTEAEHVRAVGEDLEVLEILRGTRVPEKRKAQRVLALCTAIFLWCVVMSFVAAFAWAAAKQFGSAKLPLDHVAPIVVLSLLVLLVVSMAGAAWSGARLALEGGRSALDVARRRSLVRARDRALHGAILGGGLSDAGASLEQRGELSETNRGELTRV